MAPNCPLCPIYLYGARNPLNPEMKAHLCRSGSIHTPLLLASGPRVDIPFYRTYFFFSLLFSNIGFGLKTEDLVSLVGVRK
jgi:hypothetical protein